MFLGPADGIVPRRRGGPGGAPNMNCGTGRSATQWASGKGRALMVQDTECVSYRAGES